MMPGGGAAVDGLERGVVVSAGAKWGWTHAPSPRADAPRPVGERGWSVRRLDAGCGRQLIRIELAP